MGITNLFDQARENIQPIVKAPFVEPRMCTVCNKMRKNTSQIHNRIVCFSCK